MRISTLALICALIGLSSQGFLRVSVQSVQGPGETEPHMEVGVMADNPQDAEAAAQMIQNGGLAGPKRSTAYANTRVAPGILRALSPLNGGHGVPANHIRV